MLTESQLHVLLENMPNVAVEGFDIDGRVLLWNRAAEQVFGYSELEAVGRTLDQLMLTKAAADEFVALLRSVSESGQGVGPMQWDVNKRDGTIGTVLSTIVPFPFPDGTPRFLCIDVDITETRRTELALRESEARFRTLAETSLVGLWQITPAGHTVYINPAMLELLELESATQLDGVTFHQFFTPESLERMRDEHARRAAGIASNYEVEAIGAMGTRRNVIISGAPIFDADGKLHSLIGTFTDITERKQAEKTLTKVLEEQRFMLNELDHRVRNNLASLLTLIDISAQGAKSTDDFAESIRGRVRAMSLVHSMLSYARWTALDLRLIAEMVVPSDLRKAITIEGPDLMLAPRKCTPVALVLQEFVSNSLKYGAFAASSGRVQLQWSISKSAEEGGPWLDVNWREMGGPKVDAPNSRGQGLDIVRGMVQSDLSGTIEMRFPPEGAHHTIRIPLENNNNSHR